MDQYETQWDKLLKIKTSGRDDSRADQFHYPYEPTPYCVLERLANSEYITKKNVVLDYGCGKGRVDFFLSYQTRCRTIGIDYDSRLIEQALENQKRSVSGSRSTIEFGKAEEYHVQTEVDTFFFFNPFSVKILKKVLARVIESYYENPREMKLMFYYPSDEYVSHLMTTPELMFTDEIDCQDLFPGENSRERIVIFELT